MIVRRCWTPEEDEYLRRHYPSSGPGTCVRRLGRHPSSVQTRARHLGLRYYLRGTCPGCQRGTAQARRRGLCAPCYHAGRKEGTIKIRRREWSPDEVRLLREHAGSIAELAGRLGRSPGTISAKRHRLGLTGPRKESPDPEVLRDCHAEGWTDSEIARYLGFSAACISRVLREMRLASNLKRTPGQYRVKEESLREHRLRAQIARNEYLWPACLVTDAQVVILERLVGGPQKAKVVRSPNPGDQRAAWRNLIERGLVRRRKDRLYELGQRAAAAVARRNRQEEIE